MGLMFIVDTDTDKALALFESTAGAENARKALEPTRTREGTATGHNGWRFALESYYGAGDCRPEIAARSRQRLSQLGFRYAWELAA